MRYGGRIFLLMLSFAGIGGVGGCSSLTGPGDLCNTTNGIEICTNKAEYSPGSTVSFTITNVGRTTVYQDMCSGEMVGRRSSGDPWSPVSGVVRKCSDDQTIEDVIANMHLLEPDATMNDQMKTAAFAFQGYWMIRLYMVDQDGQRIQEEPYTSAIFEIFPSAD